MVRISVGKVVWLTATSYWASDTDVLQFDDAIWLPGFAKRRSGDVVNRNSGRSFAIKDTIVSEGDSEKRESFLTN